MRREIIQNKNLDGRNESSIDELRKLDSNIES